MSTSPAVETATLGELYLLSVGMIFSPDLIITSDVIGGNSGSLTIVPDSCAGCEIASAVSVGASLRTRGYSTVPEAGATSLGVTSSPGKRLEGEIDWIATGSFSVGAAVEIGMVFCLRVGRKVHQVTSYH